MPGPRLGEERGSLPLALLAMLIVGSVISVTTATVITGQQQSRFDQGFEQSLPIAEVGLDRMVSLVESRAMTESFTMPSTPAGGGTYAGQAVRSDGTWAITSTGTAADGTQRMVQATVANASVFDQAAFGLHGANLGGGNRADSYRSGTWSGPIFTRLENLGLVCDARDRPDPLSGDRICPARATGNGVISTNGVLKLNGTATFGAVDGAEIHYASEVVADPLPGATGRCDGPLTCDGYNQPRDATLPVADGNRKLEYFRERVDPPPVTLPSSPVGEFDGANKTLGPGTYVFTNATLYSTTTFTGTPENPVVIYLTGTLRVSKQQDINFDIMNAVFGPRPSPSLLIFSATAGTAFDLSNQVRISAALYGPNGSFAGGAQSQLFGAVVANSINNNGGWKFHYDEALREVTTGGVPRASGWVEVR